MEAPILVENAVGLLALTMSHRASTGARQAGGALAEKPGLFGKVCNEAAAGYDASRPTIRSLEMPCLRS
ncbi:MULTISPECIES: hypothetical protein [Candidatus Accumulibacter]|uniref:Uncharacterized protein n=2 Tax=Candidatus Accumulibacter TaxID=327159 RepID=A0A5S4ELC9_9PROT|nr:MULTISPECIES: hypothetical protein [Candidatus Accumulibacter]MCC2866729.1 hypothetical protein [Candidatus Accumulibacter phosphatis]MCM8621115.1 hypothetical protein [Accumulibacter sp.]TMQ76136.1 hypothetical protein ACCUM_0075 [Candidatus Accumulibacter phosphatis]